ncbi:MAG: hypothetical protein M1570_00610 [Chloroflexi bacterium]|nr:hypothetical protein [Chloroflexota bacterium]
MLDLDVHVSNDIAARTRRIAEGLDWRTGPDLDNKDAGALRPEPLAELEAFQGMPRPAAIEMPMPDTLQQTEMPVGPETACHLNCTALGAGAGSGSAGGPRAPADVERARYCIQCRAFAFSAKNLRKLFGD